MKKCEQISTDYGLKMATILCLIYSGITVELRTNFNESISSDAMTPQHKIHLTKTYIYSDL